MSTVKLTSALVAGDVLVHDYDVNERVVAVEMPVAPAVVAIVHVVRRGRLEWFASGIAAQHEVA